MEEKRDLFSYLLFRWHQKQLIISHCLLFQHKFVLLDCPWINRRLAFGLWFGISQSYCMCWQDGILPRMFHANSRNSVAALSIFQWRLCGGDLCSSSVVSACLSDLTRWMCLSASLSLCFGGHRQTQQTQPI